VRTDEKNERQKRQKRQKGGTPPRCESFKMRISAGNGNPDDGVSGGICLQINCQRCVALALGLERGRCGQYSLFLHSYRYGWREISVNKISAEGVSVNCRSLHFATPDFLWSLVALMKCMRLSLRKGAHVDLFGAA
jgi:hypothetical protein